MGWPSRFALAIVATAYTTTALPQSTKRDDWTIGQAVRTSGGLIRGHEAYWPSSSGVSEYLGIRYGQAPVGDLRFAAPKAYVSNRTYVAEQWGDECMQTVGPLAKELGGPKLAALGLDPDAIEFGKALAGGFNGNFTYSEDCLNLNIWTKPQTGEKAKGVLLWIYGGAFGLGASSAQYYNMARYAAEHDLVAVSLNYRENIFGFPMAEFLETQNVGFLDQRLAVEWVRDNIAAFGGDPKRITLMGESAGGASTDYYTYAWTKDPIVNGFIPVSGTAGGLPADPPNSNSWFVVSEAVGCGGVSAGVKSVACMRQKSAAQLLDGVGKLGPVGGPSSLLAFWPVADGKTAFTDVWDRQAKGQFIQRPMLVGNNDKEGNIIVGFLKVGLDWALKQPGQVGDYAKTGQQFFNYIRNSTDRNSDMIRTTLKYVEDAVFNCPSWSAAKGRVENNVPVWRYRMMGNWTNTGIGGYGAFHVSDVPLIFGTTMRKVNAAPNSPEQEETIRNIMTGWAAFVKDPDNGLTKLGWPRYEFGKDSLIRFGYNDTGEPSFAPAEQYDRNCPSLLHVAPKAYGIPTVKKLVARGMEAMVGIAGQYVQS